MLHVDRSADPWIERALELDPRSGRDLFRLARIHWLEGRLEEAAAPLQRIQAFNPSSWADYWLMLLYEQLGRGEQAEEQREIFRSMAERWLTDYPDVSNSYVAQGLFLTHEGQPARGWDAAQRALTASSAPDRYFGLARVAAVQGNREKALDLLEEGIEAGFADYIWMKIHPDLEPSTRSPVSRSCSPRT